MKVPTASSPNWAEAKPSSSVLVRTASSVSTSNALALESSSGSGRAVVVAGWAPQPVVPLAAAPVLRRRRVYANAPRAPAAPTTTTGSTKSPAPLWPPAPPPGSASPGVIFGTGTGCPPSTAS